MTLTPPRTDPLSPDQPAGWRRTWRRWADRHPGWVQFLVFFLLSNGVTVLQLALMPLMKALFGQTALIATSFQIWPLGHNADGSTYYIFDYAAGALPAGGGGLAYFLAVELTLLVAQVINFFAQRNITFKANGSVLRAAAWYALAYVIITLAAAALQGLYKAPVYDLFITGWGLGAGGETLADVATMLINSIISFWVFFPIFKVIFRRTPVTPDDPADPTASIAQADPARSITPANPTTPADPA